MNKKDKALLFVEHIEEHFRLQPWLFEGYTDPKVMCKICDKTIDEIEKESKK